MTAHSGKRVICVAVLCVAALFAMRALAQTAVSPPPGENQIDLGEPPLSDSEMSSVMVWIAARLAALTVPFCWRQSYGNGGGEPYACGPGMERKGLLCYKTCPAGYRNTTPDFCTPVCPPGFDDIGLFCQKKTVAARQYPNAALCWKAHPEGCWNAGRNWYATCPAGSTSTIAWGRGGGSAGGCVPSCPNGMSDTGPGCAKSGDIYLGPPQPLANGVCRPGMEKDPSGALCYPSCKADFHMVGPVCWQTCPAPQSFECAAGCATDQGSCISDTVNQAISPITAAISLVSFGAGSAVAKGAQAAANAGRLAASASRLRAGYEVVKRAIVLAKGNLTELVGGAENLEKLMRAKKVGGRIYTFSTDVGQAVDKFSKEFADNFATLTNPEMNAEIDRRFGKEGAYQIKRQWGVHHLALMLQADDTGFKTAQNVVGIVAAVDPTGLVGVADAFMKPICGNNTPFPVVHPLYSR